MPPILDPAVLVGTASSDDACVYRLDDERAIVQTVDFITPIVDDPYDYGQIAAANSLSDIYAMGGRPLFALAIVGFPSKKVPLDVLAQIMKGGCDKAREAGIDIVGGHSVDDAEPKYGLVVTGLVDPRRILKNIGARPGDLLVLTKPLGSGILTTAIKKGVLAEEPRRRIIEVMKTLNRAAAEALVGLDVHALTDVTGFGLLGHLGEMTGGSGVSARLNLSAIPAFDEAWQLARQCVYPGGAMRNLEAFGDRATWGEGVPDEARIVIADPQTSGGLLIAIAPHHVDELVRRLAAVGTLAQAVIGEIFDDPTGRIIVENRACRSP